MIPHVQENRDDLDEKEYIYDTDKYKKNKKWFDWMLLNKPLKAIIIFLLATVVAPLLLYHFLFYATPTREGSCLIRRDARLPCGHGNVAEAECSSECCYDHTNHFCFHAFPSRFTYVLNETWREEVFLSPRIATVPFGSQRSLDRIRISVDEVSATHLSLNFYNSDEQIIGRRIEEKNYTYEILGENLNVVVNATQGNIFNTAHGTFIAANDIWELTFRITNETMFGLGELPLLPDTVKVIYNHKGGMSSIPLIYAKLNNNYHGFLIDTMNPTEVIIRRENQMVVRSITKTGLKFHLFVGPTPSDIMRDVMILTGRKKNLEYWMLGPHFCSDQMTLDELGAFINTAQQQFMPFESHCGVAQPYFSSECNNTHVQLVNDGATALRNQNRKFVPHISPYIRYSKPEVSDKEETTESSSEKNQVLLSRSAERCFNDEEFEQYIIRDPDAENVYIGLVNKQHVIYPKYDNVSEEFMRKLWIYEDVDGVVLKNNWPLDESEKNVNLTHLYLPYFNKNFETAFQHTPQWNATRPERYLYTHNDYGNQFATAFNMVKKNIPIISTSQWANANMVLNRQNIETSWASLHRELIEGSLAGISGNWYWSSPVCGDTENINVNTQHRLCAKWYMASTYFPMIQIISKEVRRDPLAFTGIDRTHMITALRTRASIMSYLYSVLQEGPLLRPMFYQFPSVEELTTITTQFSVGDDLLIVPNLLAGQTHVHVRMPPGKWFEFGSGFKLEGNVGQAVTMTTTEADFLTLIRGGSIMIQQPDTGSTVADTQFAPFTLLVALDCEANTTNTTICSAEGKFYMSPDMVILFEADQTTVNATAEGDNFDVFCGWSDKLMWGEDIWYIRVYGLDNDKNNNDHHFMGEVFIRLCDLKFIDKIVYKYM